MTQIAPGRWRLRVYVGRDENGEPIQASRNIRTPKRGGSRQAQEALEAFRAEVMATADKGPRHTSKGPRHTFGQLLDEWLKFLPTQVKRSTVETYETYIDKRIRPALGGVWIGDLDTKHLDDFYMGLQDAGLAAGTINQIHAIISGALKQAMLWKWEITANPAQTASPPKDRATKKPPPSPKEVDALIAAALADEYYDFAALIALGAGPVPPWRTDRTPVGRHQLDARHASDRAPVHTWQGWSVSGGQDEERQEANDSTGGIRNQRAQLVSRSPP